MAVSGAVRGEVRVDLEEIFRRDYQRVVGVAARVLGSRDQAEDVAQEVFLSFGRSSVPAGEASGWLCVAAAHAALNVLRTGRRRASREESAAASDDGVVSDVAEAVVTLEERSRVRAAAGRRRQRHGRRHVPSPEPGRRRRHTGHPLDGLDGQGRGVQQPGLGRPDRHFASEDPVGAMYAVGSGWPCRVRRRQELDSQGRRPAQSSTTERYARLHSVIFGVTRGRADVILRAYPYAIPDGPARATVVRHSGRPAIWAGQQ